MAGLHDVIESDAGALTKVVGVAAPLLAGALGSPLASVAVSLLASAFHANSDDLSDVLNAIHSDPDAALKLKTLEDQHQEALASINSQNYNAEISDRNRARDNIVVYKDFLRHLAYLVTLGFFGAIGLLCSPIQFEDHERELLSMLIGMLVSKWQTIIDFFYGSSEDRSTSNGRD